MTQPPGDLENEVATRKILLFCDFTLIVVSSVNNKELLDALKNVSAIRTSEQLTEIRMNDGSEWIAVENLEPLLRPV